MYLIAALSIISFAIFYVAHMRYVKLTLVRETRNHVRGNLNQRFELIGLMFDIIKVHIPEYGAMLEKLIKLRLESVAKADEKTSDEMHQEVYDLLKQLIDIKGYVSTNDNDLRTEFMIKHLLIESNLKAAHTAHVSAVVDYNKLAMILGINYVEAFIYPESHQIEIDDTDSVLQMLGTMAG